MFERLTCVGILVLLAGCAAAVPPVLDTLGPSHQQAVLVRSDHRRQTHASLTLWEKHNSSWQRTYQVVPAMLGRTGLASPGEKKEGDGHTPSGVYDLRTAFGYYPALATGLDYRQAGPEDLWVDDAAAPEYNQWVKSPARAASFEKLRRDDHLYEIATVIEYNTAPTVPGAGSAIFMHIWRRYDHPTSGCVALSERHLRRILKILDKSKEPVIILEEGHGHRRGISKTSGAS